MLEFLNIWSLNRRPTEPEQWPGFEPRPKLRRRTMRHLRSLGWTIDRNAPSTSKIAVRAEKAHSYVHLTFHDIREMSLKTCLQDFSEVDRQQGSVAEIAWGIFSEVDPSGDLAQEASGCGIFFISRWNMCDIEIAIKTTIEGRKKR